MGTITVDEAALRGLQRRAEAMAHGDLRLVSQPASDVPAIEDLRRPALPLLLAGVP